jgi:hypothetical protein
MLNKIFDFICSLFFVEKIFSQKYFFSISDSSKRLGIVSGFISKD